MQYMMLLTPNVGIQCGYNRPAGRGELREEAFLIQHARQRHTAIDSAPTDTSPNRLAQVANSEVIRRGRAAWQLELRPARADASMVGVVEEVA